MKHIPPVVAATLVLAGCASSRPVPVNDAPAAPLIRDAATIERGLEDQNRSDYDCQVQPDSAIVCDGVRHRVD